MTVEKTSEADFTWFKVSGRPLKREKLKTVIEDDMFQIQSKYGLLLVKIEHPHEAIVAFTQCCPNPVTKRGFKCKNCSMDARAVSQPVRPKAGTVLPNGRLVDFADSAWQEQIQAWLPEVDVFEQILIANDLGKAVEDLVNLPIGKKKWYHKKRFVEDVIVDKELKSGVRIMVMM